MRGIPSSATLSSYEDPIQSARGLNDPHQTADRPDPGRVRHRHPVIRRGKVTRISGL